MNHSDFRIGLEFVTEAGRWRCTDIGTRTITAIRLDRGDDTSWYDGPPYAIAETAFDEDDIASCEIAPERGSFGDTGKLQIGGLKQYPLSALSQICAIDYTAVIARNMPAMRTFYGDLLGFSLIRELSPNWVEYRVGGNVLALAKPRLTAADPPIPLGIASVQLAFRVPLAEVDRCAAELAQKSVALLSPPMDQSFGHRTLFFRDPDGNLLEIFAEIPSPPVSER
ncbi:glyoxalase family protein [Rhodopseudomonas palustris]|uniref:VOC family protein n=1 Tax=Rhodopseudomonas palustris TaxID=1076 RepID=UPI000D1A109D|nr:glyoxalase family protein [Rhodopseudomonas palustris]